MTKSIKSIQELVHKLKSLKLYRRGKEKPNPHKYILLLSVIALLDGEDNHGNRFTYEELEPIFLNYFIKMFPDTPPYRCMMEYPFYHLQTDGFWHLHIRPGMEHKYNDYQQLRLTKKRILETVDYAFLDKSIFELLNTKAYRDIIRGEIMDILREMGTENLNTSEIRDFFIVAEQASIYEHEQTAIQDLKRLLNQHQIGELLNNILLFDEQSRTYLEYDVIIVARSGIYVVELKHWSGHIEIAPYNWIINHTAYRQDPHQLNEFKCKVLKGIYQHRFRTYPNIWVSSIVVLTNPEAVVENADTPRARERQHSYTFASIVDLLTYLKRRDADSHVLTSQQIDAISQYIKSLNQPRTNIHHYMVPGYETIEYRYQSAEYIELLARRKGNQAQGLYRFRVFRPSAVHPDSERKRFYAKALNTLKSVELIGDHPNIHRVWMTENPEGDIIEGSSWSESGTLRDIIHQEDHNFSLEEALRICHGITQGIIRAHQTNIIHRAVRPENVLMVNGEPRLMNFDLSYHLEENRLTVMPEVTKLKDDGYIAPEILEGNDIDETTDFYGLGVIACELLGTKRPFKTVKQLRAQGGELSPEFIITLQEKGIPPHTIDVLKQLVVADRTRRLNDSNRILDAFTLETDQKDSLVISKEVNAILPEGSMHDGYEILECIGKGVEAQIYKARTIRGDIVAIKLFNREVPRAQILHEADVVEGINSEYVCRIINVGHWSNNRYYLVMEYIEGQSLRAIIDSGARPDRETFIRVVRWLMEALQAFHVHTDEDGELKPLVHGDIKPENILLTPDYKPVLIDFGISGEPRIDLFRGTISYVPPDCIKGSDRQFSESGDIFALGVVLWEWLFGSRPYEHPAIGDKPLVTESMESVLGSKLMKWLIKSVATDSDQRFESISSMQSELEEALRISEQQIPIVEEPQSVEQSLMDEDEDLSTDESPAVPQHNAFVTYLNSLSSASAGNENATAEAQIGNEYFNSIRVDNPVTDFIIERLKIQNVILTGNAGDGKTTIASEIVKRITGDYIPLKPREEIPGLTIIKDLSEIPEQDRSRVFIEAIQNPQKRFLIVSNTGTLLNNMKGLTVGKITVDENILLQVLESDAPQSLAEDHFLVINLGRLNSIPVAMQVFHKMLRAENWFPCLECSYAKSCCINLNVQALREIEDVVRERMELLYQRLYEYGNRLTMRQMTGHLAFAITGGLDCKQIALMSTIARQELLYRYLFYNLFFGDDGIDEIPEAMQLVPILQIRKEEFGIVLDPHFERRLWSASGNPIILHGKAIQGILSSLLIRSLDSYRRNQVRRLVYFSADLKEDPGRRYLQTFLRSPLLLNYLDYTQNRKSIPMLHEERLRRYVLQVLQEFFIGIRLPEGKWDSRELYVTLRPGKGKSASQMIIASVPADKLRVKIVKRYTIGEIESCSLALSALDHDIQLILDLPFLDYVVRRFEGQVAESLTAFYAFRLERFKANLLERYATSLGESSLRLLRIDKERGFREMKVVFSGDQLEVVL